MRNELRIPGAEEHRAASPADEPSNVLRILGTRGVPAAHGGFETFAQQLSAYLVDRGWRVVVYCQERRSGEVIEDQWNGIERVRIPVRARGAMGTITFDWKALRHASACRDLCLTLGYNTAVFGLLLKFRRVRNIINMDGIEWARSKWGILAKAWLWFNEWCARLLADHLIADHPEIQRHLRRHGFSGGIAMIPYGAKPVIRAAEDPVRALGLEPGGYLTVIARLEPENSVLEVIRGFSAKRRGLTLAVVGGYDLGVPFHRALRDAASDEVRFLGAIYDQDIVQALRYHSLAYVHGHQVGGTNPSLVEALGAGNPIIAHDNRFNRWVSGERAARYFTGADSFSEGLDALAAMPEKLATMRIWSRRRFEELYTWPRVLQQYEMLLLEHLPGRRRRPQLAAQSRVADSGGG